MTNFNARERQLIFTRWSEGASIADIADELGRVYQTIRNALNSRWFDHLKLEQEAGRPPIGSQLEIDLNLIYCNKRPLRALEFKTQEQAQQNGKLIKLKNDKLYQWHW